ncbi:MAG TPA: riboflavin synthase [Candidatus Deferrimicrobium sp.]|nr:riboflavin synthase [Candidatus Deferrimicrobium sp.]
MFTGIVEELGEVQEIQLQSHSALLSIKAQRVLEDVRLGDSIAVNGVCLTVVRFSSQHFTADVMAETLHKTALAKLSRGSKVNLERALQLSTRLGGHLVSGHIDGVGKILRSYSQGIARVTEISAPPEVLTLIVPKGSVAIDGISLTVVEVTEEFFSVSLIPHTFKETTLGFKGPGDQVNLENDMIGKYVHHFLHPKTETHKPKSLDLDFLSEHGFV